MRFWLGVHQPEWMERADVPLMVSQRRLAMRRSQLPRARAPWILDSGGFTELSRPAATYKLTPQEYVSDVRRYMREVGNLEHAAIQDWMCEPQMLAHTGLDIPAHQRLTVESYLSLANRAPEVPWLPVLQGQSVSDYLHHVDMYLRCGVDLWAHTLVGLGSVCRRQHTDEAVDLVLQLSKLKLPLHGFGFKTSALVHCGPAIESADSMAWSLDGRLPHGGRCSPTRDHVCCNNCLDYALRWRTRLLGRLTQAWLPEFAFR